MRLAIISTPRAGNTWIRGILARSFGLQEIAAHDWADFPELPEECAAQIHWYREPHFQRYLKAHRFRVVTVARHPLDILLSVLAFVRHEPQTSQWLAGNCAIPETMVGADPTSDVFLEWAMGFGAENLLSISYQWWHEATAIRVKYEDAVKQPLQEFGRVVEVAGVGTDVLPAVRRIPDALRALPLSGFKAMPNKHGWQGSPGLWKSLISQPDAKAIYARHRHVFTAMRYDSNGAEVLTKSQISETWRSLG